MKRLHDQTAGPRLHVDPTQGTQSHPASRLKTMKEAPLRSRLDELLLETPKHLGLDRFELEAGLIAGATAAFHPVAPLACDAMRQEPPLLRERLGHAGSHLSERQPVLPPRDKMAGGGDRNGRRIGAPLDRTLGTDLEEFRMEHAAIELEDQLGHLGAKGNHDVRSPGQ